MRAHGFVLLAVFAASIGGAVTFQEDFSTDPAADGWQVFGNTNLFQWDPINQNLAVTWDSDQANSYFYHSLGTILASNDSFHLSFDLVFQDYAIGTNADQPYAFPAGCVGFLNLVQATQTNFSRGAGIDPTNGPDNLVEFDFFPAFDVFRPTIDQIVVSTNNAWLFNHKNLLEMTPGELFRVDMVYSGTTGTLTTTLTNNGVQYGRTQTIQVPSNFDFRTGVVSVSSYSGQNGNGSVLAHGTVANLLVTVPPPPISNLAGSISNGFWQAQFLNRSNWVYTLERSVELQSWVAVSAAANGNGASLILQDTNPPSAKGFYRVKAERP